jgi:hypothetical protein
MRRPINWVVFLGSLLVLFVSVGLPGRGGGGSSAQDITLLKIDETGMLHRVRSAAELEGLLQEPWRTAGGDAVLMGAAGLSPPSVDATLFPASATVVGGSL